MTASEKIKIIDNKIKQNKSLRQIAKILALSSGNVGKYEFLTGEKVLPEKGVLEKAATIKRFEYSPLGSELKKQIDIANKKQYQGLDKVYEFDGTISKDDKKATLKTYNKSVPIYDASHSFCKCRNIKKFDNLSYISKHSFLASFLMI